MDALGAELPLFLGGLIAAGLLAGFVGGLFGIGGGVVVVPALYFVLTALGVDEAIRMHVAVGTSLSTIISTSWRSLAAHTKAGAVDYDILKAWAPWITVGALLGAAAAGFASTETLLLVFGIGLLLIAAQMGLGTPDWRLAQDLPSGAPRAAIAGGIGFFSALMGIGGGAFGVTVMTLCGRPIHRAVATASGCGAAIALPAALGYVVAGWGREGLAALVARFCQRAWLPRAGGPDRNYRADRRSPCAPPPAAHLETRLRRLPGADRTQHAARSLQLTGGAAANRSGSSAMMARRRSSSNPPQPAISASVRPQPMQSPIAPLTAQVFMQGVETTGRSMQAELSR